ncbi:MAG: hypothetical protein ACI8RZ_004251, partial [Myxococcota bacterium]
DPAVNFRVALAADTRAALTADLAE